MMSESLPANSVPTPVPVTSQTTPPRKFASFGRRFGAVVIDSILLGMANAAISQVFSNVSNSAARSSEIAVAYGLAGFSFMAVGLQLLIGLGYPILCIATRGQTVGKMLLKIKVINVQTGQHPDIVGAILREGVGKFISGLAFSIGYLAMLWDPKSQTWHDKIAHTIVIEE